MKKQLPIYIERLRDGRIEHVQESIDSKMLDISDADAKFSERVAVSAKAYTADDFLLVELTISAKAELMCSVCNEPFFYPIEIRNAIFETALDEITDAVFDLYPLVRECVLLEIPFYPQCAGASCKNRESLDRYFKNDASKESENTLFKPFENL